MTDVHTPEQRRYNMSRILGKNTKPEMTIRRLLWKEGLRGYRIHYDLPGKPDIVFTRKKTIIFIDGCFWHKCPECFREPKTNTDFWMQKINQNVQRDKEVNAQLSTDGWTVLRFWEHDVRKDPENVIRKIRSALSNTESILI